MRIEPLYEGCHAIIAASGPSLTGEVASKLKEASSKYAIFAVGDAYKLLPFADELYACDGAWWEIHGEKVKETCPNTRLWCYDEQGKKFGANKLNGAHNQGFSTNPDLIHFGSNSGYQMLNLAYLWGCRKMILVGYNMQAVQGKSHFFKDRAPKLMKQSPYHTFVQKFNTVQRDIRPLVVNCTPDTALTAFRLSTLEEELTL